MRVLDEQVRSQKFYCLDLCMGEGHAVTGVGLSVSECCVALTTLEDLYEHYRVTEGDKVRTVAWVPMESPELGEVWEEKGQGKNATYSSMWTDGEGCGAQPAQR